MPDTSASARAHAAMQSAMAERWRRWRRPVAAGSGSSRARRRGICAARKPRPRSNSIETDHGLEFLLELALWHAELPAIHVGLASDRVARRNEIRIVLARQWFEAGAPAFALHRKTLGDRSAFRQQSIETRVMPVRREIGRGVVKCVGIDQAGERGERQVGPVYGMGE